MKKIWFLSSCDTCSRIIKELGLKEKGFEFIDLKNNPIDKTSLNLIKEKTQMSYEELFNKRSIKYSKSDLKDKLKTQSQFESEILKEYTFIKRPIIQIENEFFVGNSKSVVESAKNKL
jgi:arsenate reductase